MRPSVFADCSQLVVGVPQRTHPGVSHCLAYRARALRRVPGVFANLVQLLAKAAVTNQVEKGGKLSIYVMSHPYIEWCCFKPFYYGEDHTQSTSSHFTTPKTTQSKIEEGGSTARTGEEGPAQGKGVVEGRARLGSDDPALVPEAHIGLIKQKSTMVLLNDVSHKNQQLELLTSITQYTIQRNDASK